MTFAQGVRLGSCAIGTYAIGGIACSGHQQSSSRKSDLVLRPRR